MKELKEIMNTKIDRPSEMYSDPSEGLSDTERLRSVEAIMRTASRVSGGADPKEVAAAFLRLRDIENSLDRRMWAGVRRPKLARHFLRDDRQTHKRSLGFGPRRDCVAASLETGFRTGKLTLYIVVDEARFIERFKHVPSWAREPMPVPEELLGRVFIKDTKGTRRLPASFAIRPSRKLAGNDRLFALLNCGHLVVRAVQFRRWLRSERKKRRWPSQNRPHAKPKRNPVGRPSKLNAVIEAAILAAGREKFWDGGRPIAELHRFLTGQGLNVPSVDTLARGIDALFAETGEPWLGRRRRVRRK